MAWRLPVERKKVRKRKYPTGVAQAPHIRLSGSLDPSPNIHITRSHFAKGEEI